MPVLSKIIEGEIDPEMLTLVREMNRLGLETIACCSGHPEMKAQPQAYVAFKSEDVTVLLSGGTVSVHWKRS